MSNYALRALRSADLDRVAEIEGKISGSPRKTYYGKQLALVAANPDSFVSTVVEDGGKLMGFGLARVQRGEFGIQNAVAVLDVLGVDSDARGKGIGRAVLSGIEQQLKERNIDILKTQVAWTDSVLTAFFCGNGFKLGSSQVIERDTSPLKENVAEMVTIKTDSKWQVHSAPDCNHYERLARDKVLVRSFKAEDLPAVVRIDGKLTGTERPVYFSAKAREVLDESGIMVSLVAEDSGIVSGFIMARVDFGEFGKVETEAVIDTIGVHPAYRETGVGHALLSQLLLNLSSLKVETVRTQVWWENFELQRFLHGCGFGPSQRLVLTKAVS